MRMEQRVVQARAPLPVNTSCTISSALKPSCSISVGQSMTWMIQCFELGRLDAIRAAGFEASASIIAPGVTDISAPILNHLHTANAALTILRIGLSYHALPLEQAITELRTAAEDISTAIGGLPS